MSNKRNNCQAGLIFNKVNILCIYLGNVEIKYEP